ncbi:MAG: phosphatidate cytidylyltransferase [Phycisphaerales bacterium]|nr:phosphatidate cytidylyltransferase [Phycisphaerales bacterium]
MGFRDEIARKSIHGASALIPLAYWAFAPRWLALSVVACLLAVAVAIELARRRPGPVNRLVTAWFGGMLRPFEKSGWSGATFVLLAGLITIALFPQMIAVAALLVLAISDSLASLIGSRFGKARFLGGSMVGSGAFFVSAAAICLLVLPFAPVAGLLASAAATIVEAAKFRVRGVPLDDNLSVPLVVAGVLWLLIR